MAEAVKTLRVYHPDEHFEGGHLINECDFNTKLADGKTDDPTSYKSRRYTTSKPGPKK